MTESTARPHLDAFSSRLGEMRRLRGVSQAEFGRLGGVSRNAESLYESGSRAPDAEYLMSLAKAGVDVCYVLTGMVAGLSAAGEEAALLNILRRCCVDDRRRLIDLAHRFADSAPPPGSDRATPHHQIPLAQPDPLAAIPADALEETLFHLLDGIDQRASADERAHLLAARLPNALSLLRDLQPASPPLGATGPAPAPARGAAPATPARERTS